MKKIALLIAVFGLSLFLIPVLLRSFVAKSPTLIANSFSQDGTYNPKAGLAFYDYRFMRVPPYAPTQHLSASVLGKDSSKKRIEVDLTKQKLLAFEYGAKIMADKIYYTFGGGGANSAVSFANLGLKTAMVAKVGA
ncbi:MAG: Carbohydrate kinase PfkB, partial [candidate division WWE3 bacterium GW2011_GWC2_44_9]